MSHITSNHSKRASDRDSDGVRDIVEENRKKKTRRGRDRRIKGQRVLRSERTVCKWTCSCPKIDANHSGYMLQWRRRCCEFQSKKKKKRRTDALVIDKTANVKEVMHEREKRHSDGGRE